MSWQDVTDMFAGMCEQVSEWSSCDDCPMFRKVDDFSDCRREFARMITGSRVIATDWIAEIEWIGRNPHCGMCGAPLNDCVCGECGAYATSNGQLWDGTITEPSATQTAPRKAIQR